MKISKKYFFSFSLLAIAIISSIYILYEFYIIPNTMEIIKSSSHTFAKTLQRTSPRLSIGEMQKLFEETFKGQKEFSYILFIDKSGVALAHSNPQRVGMKFDDAGTLKASLQGIAHEQIYFRDVSTDNSPYRNEKTLDIIYPAYDSLGNHVGAIKVGVSFEEIDKIKSKYHISLIIIIFIVLLSFTVIILRIYFGTAKNITRISNTIREITEGKYDSNLVINRNDELGELSKNITTMKSSITHLIYELKKNESDLIDYLNSLLTFNAKVSPAGKIIFINSAASKSLGAEQNHLIGRNFADLLHWTYSDEIHQTILDQINFAAIGRSVSFEILANTATDEKIYLDCSINPVFSENNKVEYLIIEGRNINEKKLAEERIKSWSTRYEMMIEASGLVAFEYDISSRCVNWGGSLNLALGYTPATMGNNILEWHNKIHKDDIKRVLKSIDVSKVTQRGYEIEYRILNSSGKYDWVYERGQFLYDDKGATYKIIGLIENIQKRKHNEQLQNALLTISQSASNSENLDELYKIIHDVVAEFMPANNFYIAQYNIFTDSISFPYFLDEVDEPILGEMKLERSLTAYVIKNGKKLLASPEIFNLLVAEGLVDNIGAPSIDWLGVPLKIEDRVIGAIVVQSYTEGVRFTEEDMYLLEFVSSQIAMSIERKRAEEGMVQAYNQLEDKVQERTAQWQQANEELQSLLDERVQIEKDIRESEERFRSIADSTPAMIWMADEMGIFDYFNRTWLEFTGDSYEDQLGNKWMNSIHPEDKIEFAANFSNMINLSSDINLEYRQKRFDGQYRWIYNKGVPRKLDSELLGYVGMCFDITDRKFAENKMLDSLEREQELNAMKSRFVSMVSHEYRTPLTSIQTSTYLIEKFLSIGDKENASKFLERIRESITRMTSLLEEVLMVSRVQSSSKTNAPKIFNIVDYAKSILSEISAYDKAAHIIDAKYSDTKIIIQIDERILAHIFQNLMSNATKFSEPNTVIEFEISKNERSVFIRVKDNGRGIPANEVGLLFEPFYRASNVGTVGGSGLGLSITKQCIESCGGKISVVSEENKGSEFIVELPILTED